MKKIFPVILTVFVVAALAGVLYVRVNVRQVASGGTDAQETRTEPTGRVEEDGPIIAWAVRPPYGEAGIFTRSVSSGKTTGPIDWIEGLAPVRFNQSSNLCDPAYVTTPIAISCRYDDRWALALTAYDGDGGPRLLTKTIDPRALDVTPSAAEGYLVPVAVAADKSAIYLGRRVETESWVAGLWKIDVATGKLTEISYVREHDVYHYDIDPVRETLFGISFVPPESLGGTSSRSELHWIDLATGQGYGGESFVDSWENPIIGDGGEGYAFYASGEHAKEGSVIMRVGETTADGGTFLPRAVIKDWFGDTVVFDRDGNLFLYDLKTETETQITHEADALVEYLGVTR